MRSAGHRVTNEHHAVAEATLVEKLKGRTNLLGKHTLPSADQDRRAEEMDLVNQTHPPCGGCRVGAGDCQVMIDACLDLSDGLGIERALDPGSLCRDLME